MTFWSKNLEPKDNKMTLFIRKTFFWEKSKKIEKIPENLKSQKNTKTTRSENHQFQQEVISLSNSELIMTKKSSPWQSFSLEGDKIGPHFGP